MLAKVSRPTHVRSTTKTSDRMRSIRHLKALVVVDSTEGSKRVLRYLGQLAAAGDQPEFHLAYIASRVPAELLETGGAETPDREEQIQSNLRRQQQAWMAGPTRRPGESFAPRNRACTTPAWRNGAFTRACPRRSMRARPQTRSFCSRETRTATRSLSVIPRSRGSAPSAVATSRNSSCGARRVMQYGSSARRHRAVK